MRNVSHRVLLRRATALAGYVGGGGTGGSAVEKLCNVPGGKLRGEYFAFGGVYLRGRWTPDNVTAAAFSHRGHGGGTETVTMTVY